MSTRPLRVLALDHFFDQDLSELERSNDLEVLRLSYQVLRRAAIRTIGAGVVRDMGAYDDPALADGRRRWEARLERQVRRLHRHWAFDVIILPSDTLFYIRALPAITERLGLPTIVVQRETTISPDTLDAFALEVKEAMPFISHFMTACSDVQRAFWIRAGADPEKIVVTGQPRFDRYARATPPRTGGTRRVLFLSYHLDAYEPGVGQGMGKKTWEPLREATERVLADAVATGDYEVLVKPHPQQPIDEDRTRLMRLAGSAWPNRFRLVDRLADTRDLIAEADIVVGFQTTAMYEAVAAGRPAIYTAWGADEEIHRQALVPFHLAPSGTLVTAGSPQELRSLLDTAPAPDLEVARAWFKEALGPIDGDATARVVRALHEFAAVFSGSDLPQRGVPATAGMARMLVRGRSLALDHVIKVGGEVKRRWRARSQP